MSAPIEARYTSSIVAGVAGLKARVRGQLAQRAPRIEDAARRASWRRRNRARAGAPEIDPAVARTFLDPLLRDGIAVGRFEDLFGSTELYEEAAARAHELYAQHTATGARESEGAKPYLTKLLGGVFGADDVFARIALHPNALAVANGYMRMRTTLRALDLWLTRPLPGEAIQTQLWHRDGDDYMNVKMFVLFTDVTDAAGPFVYAPGTHPLGSRRTLPERDEHGRSVDEQMAAVVPPERWLYARGTPGTVVFADTCGYHKQQKPTSDERLLLMSQYVSGTPLVQRAVELRGFDSAGLSADQRVAVFGD